MKGIEPSYQLWKSCVLPLNYTRELKLGTNLAASLVKQANSLRSVPTISLLGSTTPVYSSERCYRANHIILKVSHLLNCLFSSIRWKTFASSLTCIHKNAQPQAKIASCIEIFPGIKNPVTANNVANIWVIVVANITCLLGKYLNQVSFVLAT